MTPLYGPVCIQDAPCPYTPRNRGRLQASSPAPSAHWPAANLPTRPLATSMTTPCPCPCPPSVEPVLHWLVLPGSPAPHPDSCPLPSPFVSTIALPPPRAHTPPGLSYILVHGAAISSTSRFFFYCYSSFFSSSSSSCPPALLFLEVLPSSSSPIHPRPLFLPSWCSLPSLSFPPSACV